MVGTEFAAVEVFVQRQEAKDKPASLRLVPIRQATPPEFATAVADVAYSLTGTVKLGIGDADVMKEGFLRCIDELRKRQHIFGERKPELRRMARMVEGVDFRAASPETGRTLLEAAAMVNRVIGTVPPTRRDTRTTVKPTYKTDAYNAGA